MQTPYDQLTEAQKQQLWKLAIALSDGIKSFEGNNPSAQTVTEYASNLHVVAQNALNELLLSGVDDELPEFVSTHNPPPLLQVTDQQIVRINVV